MKTPAVYIVNNRKNKAGSRLDKIRLIERGNVDWLDLYEPIACN
jgi:hypothetical protein